MVEDVILELPYDYNNQLIKMILLNTSTRATKKFMVKINDKLIHFGQRGADDFTITKDEEQKKRYLQRHKKRENWTKKGIETAGFWSRWLLWNQPSIDDSIKDIEKRFKVSIRR